MKKLNTVQTQTRADDVRDELEYAIKRVEVANSEGNPILLAWLPGARVALANYVSPVVDVSEHKTRIVWLTGIHLAAVVATGIALNMMTQINGAAGKLLSGFLIFSLMFATKALISVYLPDLLRGRLPRLEANRLVNLAINLFMLAIVLLMSVLSVASWYVSWTATTGVWFGIGALVAAFAADYGFTKAITLD